MSEVIAILECLECGAWRDTSYAFLHQSPGFAAWKCFGCGNYISAGQRGRRTVTIPDAADARFYSMWLAGAPGNHRGDPDYYWDPEIDVRPVLEPLL